jgi:hypothetical protein
MHEAIVLGECDRRYGQGKEACGRDRPLEYIAIHSRLLMLDKKIVTTKNAKSTKEFLAGSTLQYQSAKTNRSFLRALVSLREPF